VKVFNLPGSGENIAIAGDYAYVAHFSKGLQVIDIRNPRRPRRIGGYNIPDLSLSVAISEGYIYLANIQSGLWIFRLSSSNIASSGLKKEMAKISYPNPFNPECYIPVNVKCKMQNVKCKIYNILGQLVRVIKASESKIFPGYWDGKDNRGSEMPSGVYFYEVSDEVVRRMMVVK
jgi:hypothetical protein